MPAAPLSSERRSKTFHSHALSPRSKRLTHLLIHTAERKHDQHSRNISGRDLYVQERHLHVQGRHLHIRRRCLHVRRRHLIAQGSPPPRRAKIKGAAGRRPRCRCGAEPEARPRRSRGLAEGAAEHRWRRGRSAYLLLCQTATIIIQAAPRLSDTSCKCFLNIPPLWKSTFLV